MSEISIETQKKLMFIPVVNLFSIFIWLYNCHYWSRPSNVLLKGAFMSFVCILAVVIIQYILLQLFPACESVFGLLAMYFGPMAMSYGLIIFQEKYLDE